MAIDKTVAASLSSNVELESGSVTGEFECADKEHRTCSSTVEDVIKNVHTETDTGCEGGDPETKENDGLPIDRGWAWVVLAGRWHRLVAFKCLVWLKIGYHTMPRKKTGFLKMRNYVFK